MKTADAPVEPETPQVLKSSPDPQGSGAVMVSEASKSLEAAAETPASQTSDAAHAPASAVEKPEESFGLPAQPGNRSDASDAPAPSPSSGVRGRSVRRRRLAAAAAALAAAVAAAAGWLYWDIAVKPLSMPDGVDSVDVLVEEGDAAIRVVQKIQDAGLGLSGRQMRILLRWQPDAVNRFHVGLYRFERGSTAKDVLDTLMKLPVIDQQVRIPDGARIWDVQRILADGVNLKQTAADLSSEALRKKLGLQDFPSIEGFIAPDTYRYSSGSTDLAVLKMAVARQKKTLEAAWAGRSPLADDLRNPYELLILASIIEKETGVKGDRHLVSSVFHNRLKAGMPLQTDPTVIYGLGPSWSGRLTRKDLQTATPYNTYKIPALPPTPISNPTAASIEAAAHPADTEYLYFVARGDGSSEFTTNLRDHNRAIEHFIFKKKSSQPFQSKYKSELERMTKEGRPGRTTEAAGSSAESSAKAAPSASDGQTPAS